MSDVDPLRYVRLDVSAVPHQGGYIAKQCPVVAQLRHDPTVVAEPVPVPETLQRRFDAGRLFEAEIFTELHELRPDALILDPEARDLIDRTVEAMRAGVEIIVAGQLPNDDVGRRVGKPDLLVRVDGAAEASGKPWSYVPVDVKAHATVRSDASGTLGPARCSPLHSPTPAGASASSGEWTRKRPDDVLQLAHYWRMLEAAGFAPPAPRLAGIIGTERAVTWLDLDAAVWLNGGKKRSALERYDFEFCFRLDVIARARTQGQPAADPPLVVPLYKRECDDCEWRELCVPELEAADHVTLVPKVGYPQWVTHRDRGVTTRAQLAALDTRTSLLLDQGVDIPRWQHEAGALDPTTPIDAIPIHATKQQQTLLDHGILLAGDLLALDPRTAAYSDAHLSNLTRSIDLARLALANAVARHRRVTEIVVPRADVELDIDLESSGERVYLWGVLVSGSHPSIATGYRPFVTFDVLDDDREAALFADFWAWLTDVRRTAADAGLSLRAYCHSGESAENRQMRSACRRFEGRPGIPALDEVNEFLGSAQWADMRQVVSTQLLTPFGNGLKALATYAGFTWRDDDPGGEQSLAWYELATAHPDASVRAENQHRVLEYNEDDCRATRHLREWLQREGPSLLSLEDVDGPDSPGGPP